MNIGFRGKAEYRLKLMLLGVSIVEVSISAHEPT